MKFITVDSQPETEILSYLYDFIPILGLVMKNPLELNHQYFNEIIDYTKDIYKTHEKSFEEDMRRDFCDELIAAKREADCHNRKQSEYLNDENIASIMVDLVLGNIHIIYQLVQSYYDQLAYFMFC